jgi:hypothetical protein
MTSLSLADIFGLSQELFNYRMRLLLRARVADRDELVGRFDFESANG